MAVQMIIHSLAGRATFTQ